MPEATKPKGAFGDGSDVVGDDADAILTPKVRPDVTQKGHDMIGDFRTDALHDALGRAPLEAGMLMSLMVLAFAGPNVRVDSGADGTFRSDDGRVGKECVSRCKFGWSPLH